MPDRNKVIAIAIAETGYLEKSKSAYQKNPDILNEKTAGAGRDNYTKYGKEMHEIYPSVMDFPAPWCDCFVDWCFQRAYGVTTAKSLLAGNFDDYTVESAKMYQKHNALDRNPERGAQIFFSRSGGINGIYHTGLVYAVDDSYVYTIEGNTSSGAEIVANGGAVCKKAYAKHSTAMRRAFFGHPAYNDEVKTVGATKATYTINGYALHDVSYGDQDEAVRFLQQLLTAKGFPCTADGICGDKTLKALAEYQASKRRTTCGKGTWETLLK